MTSTKEIINGHRYCIDLLKNIFKFGRSYQSPFLDEMIIPVHKGKINGENPDGFSASTL